MAKVNMSELAEMLSTRCQLNKREAQQFMTAVVETIQEGINNDKMIKIKGLGTFKVIGVDARESVNVNTGERVTINGHQKLSFTPDNAMKELVNKPFSQFETVILNDGVQFDDVEPGTQENENTEITEPTEENVMPETQESSDLPEMPETSDTPDLPEMPDTSETQDDLDEPETSDTQDDLDEPETPSHSYWWAWLLLALAACVISFAGGYLLGRKIDRSSKAEYTENTIVQTDSLTKAGPVVDKTATDTLHADTPKAATAETKEPEVKEPATKVPAVKEQEPVWEKYEAMDGRVRTGAYYIVGDDYTVKARSNDSMKRIAKRTLGDGMECYIEVYNNLTAASPLKEGQSIKIPKLELKKKLKKNTNK